MTAVSLRGNCSVLRAVFTAVLLFSFVGVSDADAQGRRRGHVLHHDSSNPPPGHQKGKGQGHHKTPAFSVIGATATIVSPQVQFVTMTAVLGVHGMLRDGNFASPEFAIDSGVQHDLAGLLDGSSDRAMLSLMSALRGPDNDGAAREAAKLVSALSRLSDEPETFPAAAIAYNDFIDSSSDAFVLDPPEELLAIRAVLFAVLEPTVKAAEDDDDDEVQSQY